jgi:hypothetical protein
VPVRTAGALALALAVAVAPPPAAARLGDYVNVSTIGLHLLAIVAARELGLVTDAEAVARTTAVLDTLDRLERHGGFFFNYYDTTSLERTSHLLSFVDSAWLTAGLMVVRTAFPVLPEVTAPGGEAARVRKSARRAGLLEPEIVDALGIGRIPLIRGAMLDAVEAEA